MNHKDSISQIKQIIFSNVFGVYSMNSNGAKNSKNKHEERTIGKRAEKLKLNELWMIKTTFTYPWRNNFEIHSNSSKPGIYAKVFPIYL